MFSNTDGATHEHRRRLLAGIALATAVLCAVAAASAVRTVPESPAPILLVVAAGGALAVAVLVWTGRADWLAEDDQVLWMGSNDGE